MKVKEAKEAFDRSVSRNRGELRVMRYDSELKEFVEVTIIRLVAVDLPEGEEEVIYVE